jgi:hypothetical protein
MRMMGGSPDAPRHDGSQQSDHAQRADEVPGPHAEPSTGHEHGRELP